METNRKSSCSRRVTGRQLEMLWEFLDSNKSIANATNRSIQAKEYAQKKWKEIALVLNKPGNGALKDWRGWSKYWVDYKAKIKGRIQAARSSHDSDYTLTEIEERFLQFLGDDFSERKPVRYESRSPSRSPHPAISTSPVAHSSKFRRRKRKPPMSQEAARQALVRSSEMSAEAAVRTSEAMESMVQIMSEFQNTALRIESILNGAFPTTAEPGQST